MTASVLRIAVLYPELLGTYGDGGNALVLARRMTWRKLPVEFVHVSLTDRVPSSCDLYLLGGGEDDAQAAALAALRRTRGLGQAVGRGAQVLAVCAGLQMLGVSITAADGSVVDGLALLDVTTARRKTRAVGELVAVPQPQLGLPLLTGFENHGGGTRLGPDATPLATVRTGVGNGADWDGGDGDGEQRCEGVQQGAVVATYLHGPVLARNPALADMMLGRALGRPLPPLKEPAVERLRHERLAARPAAHGRLRPRTVAGAIERLRPGASQRSAR